MQKREQMLKNRREVAGYAHVKVLSYFHLATDVNEDHKNKYSLHQSVALIIIK